MCHTQYLDTMQNVPIYWRITRYSVESIAQYLDTMQKVSPRRIEWQTPITFQLIITKLTACNNTARLQFAN